MTLITKELNITKGLGIACVIMAALWLKTVVYAFSFLINIQHYKSFGDVLFALNCLVLPLGVILLLQRNNLGCYICCYWLIYYFFGALSLLLGVVSFLYFTRGGDFVSATYNYQGPNIWLNILLLLLAVGVFSYLNLFTVRRHFGVGLKPQRITIIATVIFFTILHYEQFYHYLSGAEFDYIDSIR